MNAGENQAAAVAGIATESRQCAVRIRGVTRTFGSGAAQVEALRGIDLDLAMGEFVAVMGPSGSGKSSLLHLIGGLDIPSSGSIEVGGLNLANLSDDELTLLRRKKVGFVFQSFNLLEVLTAQENVALPLLLDGVADAEANRRALAVLELVDIQKRSSHLPSELSGGEQQRVALARALVTAPLLLLADEPAGNLDSAAADQVMHLLRRLVDERGQTTLMVTHNPRHAALADRLLRLRDGRIVEEQSLPRVSAPEKILEGLEANPG